MRNPSPMRKRWTYFIAQYLLFVFPFATIITNGLGQEARRKPAEPLKSKYEVNTKREENTKYWIDKGAEALSKAKKIEATRGRATNAILFVGDGMGITTITAARILAGQTGNPKYSGEENSLSFEEFPYLALSKTYSANQQTSDSAPTMTAMVTGVKTKDGILSFDQRVARGNPPADEKEHVLKTILEIAERQGLSTGVVSTARLTHATPAACYAHSVERNWESVTDIPEDKRKDAKDIALQLIEFPGNGLEVALGGGRDKFLPRTSTDSEDTKKKRRSDGKNLIQKWKEKGKEYEYVSNKEELDKVISRNTTHLLGLFNPDHMEYEHDRKNGGEPSLTDMTTKALDILSKKPNGYFLMVEGGRIDHGHHEGNAFKALTETIELSKAVQATVSKLEREGTLNDTLIIVTADHSHAFTMAGYPTRGNPILGLVRSNNEKTGKLEDDFAKDKRGLPYTTLGYANGPGYKGRPDLSKIDNVNDPDDPRYLAPDDPRYLQDSTVPLAIETHGGEDVAIFASGPGAYLFHGIQEQTYIFYVLYDALDLSTKRSLKTSSLSLKRHGLKRKGK